MRIIAVWQEYDCSKCGLDHDLIGEKILIFGDRVLCPSCGAEQIAGKNGPSQTAVQFDTDEIEWRHLPNADEKANLLARLQADNSKDGAILA